MKIEQLQLQVSQDIAEYPDSSYFFDIRCIELYNQDLYFLDAERRDVAKTDIELTTVEYIGRGGMGPGELLFPATVFIFQDTISILDPSRGIFRYKDQVFVDWIEVDDLKDYRFFSNEEGYFLPTKSPEGIFQIVPHKKDEKITYHGNVEKYESPVRTRILNGRNLHSHSSGIVTVPEGLAFIEIYDWDTKELITRFDLSNLDPYKKNLIETKKRMYAENSYSVFMNDSYLWKNDLFILCTNLELYGYAYSIIKLNLEKDISVESIINLPGMNYGAICITDNFLIAFNVQEAKIEKYERVGF